MAELYEMPHYETVGEFVSGHLVRVDLVGDERDAFLTIRETLTRMGVASYKDDGRRLYQTCNILQKQGRYFIVHYKEMLILDGQANDLTDDDISRRNRIIDLLTDWDMIKVPDDQKHKLELMTPTSFFKVIPHREKAQWDLTPQYVIGNNG